MFEAASALVQRRRPCDLYHSALAVIVPEGRSLTEMAPAPIFTEKGEASCPKAP